LAAITKWFNPFLSTKDVSKRPVGSPVDNGSAKRNHFALIIKKMMQLLIKLQKRASVK
jgi:hypothetical protein